MSHSIIYWSQVLIKQFVLITEEDHAFVDDIWSAVEKEVSRDEVIKALNSVEWDGDAAYDILT